MTQGPLNQSFLHPIKHNAYYVYKLASLLQSNVRRLYVYALWSASELARKILHGDSLIIGDLPTSISPTSVATATTPPSPAPHIISAGCEYHLPMNIMSE
jgi:hypothetical protein